MKFNSGDLVYICNRRKGPGGGGGFACGSIGFVPNYTIAMICSGPLKRHSGIAYEAYMAKYNKTYIWLAEPINIGKENQEIYVISPR